jgi:hypothetical protein
MSSVLDPLSMLLRTAVVLNIRRANNSGVLPDSSIRVSIRIPAPEQPEQHKLQPEAEVAAGRNTQVRSRQLRFQKHTATRKHRASGQ